MAHTVGIHLFIFLLLDKYIVMYLHSLLIDFYSLPFFLNVLQVNVIQYIYSFIQDLNIMLWEWWQHLAVD
jgi:hypothetical protein